MGPVKVSGVGPLPRLRLPRGPRGQHALGLSARPPVAGGPAILTRSQRSPLPLPGFQGAVPSSAERPGARGAGPTQGWRFGAGSGRLPGLPVSGPSGAREGQWVAPGWTEASDSPVWTGGSDPSAHPRRRAPRFEERVAPAPLERLRARGQGRVSPALPEAPPEPKVSCAVPAGGQGGGFGAGGGARPRDAAAVDGRRSTLTRRGARSRAIILLGSPVVRAPPLPRPTDPPPRLARRGPSAPPAPRRRPSRLPGSAQSADADASLRRRSGRRGSDWGVGENPRGGGRKWGRGECGHKRPVPRTLRGTGGSGPGRARVHPPSLWGFGALPVSFLHSLPPSVGGSAPARETPGTGAGTTPRGCLRESSGASERSGAVPEHHRCRCLHCDPRRPGAPHPPSWGVGVGARGLDPRPGVSQSERRASILHPEVSTTWGLSFSVSCNYLI